MGIMDRNLQYGLLEVLTSQAFPFEITADSVRVLS